MPLPEKSLPQVKSSFEILGFQMATLFPSSLEIRRFQAESRYPPIPLSKLAPVTLFTMVLQIRIVTIRIRLMPLEKA